MGDMEKIVNALKQCISADMTCKGCPYEGTTCTTTLNTDVLNLLKGVAPVIKTEPIIYAYWRDVNPYDKHYGRCSNCHNTNWKTAYCPDCGAKILNYKEN